MANYKRITSAEIVSGQPVTSSIMQKAQSNFDNLNDRLTNVESSSFNASEFLDIDIPGNFSAFSPASMTTVRKIHIGYNCTVTGALLTIDLAGTSGITQIDIKRYRPVYSGGVVSSFTSSSIFTTLPSVASTVGINGQSINGVINSTSAVLLAGDMLYVSINSAQVGGSGLSIRLNLTRN
jgi:hypothetical protein